MYIVGSGRRLLCYTAFYVKFKQLYKFCRDSLYYVLMQINLFMLVMAGCFHNSRSCLFCNGLIRLYININWVTNKCTLSDIQTDTRYGCEEMEPKTPYRDMDSVNIELSSKLESNTWEMFSKILILCVGHGFCLCMNNKKPHNSCRFPRWRNHTMLRSRQLRERKRSGKRITRSTEVVCTVKMTINPLTGKS